MLCYSFLQLYRLWQNDQSGNFVRSRESRDMKKVLPSWGLILRNHFTENRLRFFLTCVLMTQFFLSQKSKCLTIPTIPKVFLHDAICFLVLIDKAFLYIKGFRPGLSSLSHRNQLIINQIKHRYR